MEAVKESLSQLSHTFNQKLSEFEERQQKIIPATSSASSLAAEFSSFKEFILQALRALQVQVEMVARDQDKLEMHSRRKVFLLHGVSEEKNEDTLAVVVKTIAQKLKLPHFKSEDISRCHRMGRSSNPERSRPILFKVRDMSTRSKIWAAKTNLKGTGITISEFLTKMRHETFMTARQRFGVTKCWTREGIVYVLQDDGSRRQVCSIAELDTLTTTAVTAAAPTKQFAAKETTTAKTKRTASSKK